MPNTQLTKTWTFVPLALALMAGCGDGREERDPFGDTGWSGGTDGGGSGPGSGSPGSGSPGSGGSESGGPGSGGPGGEGDETSAGGGHDEGDDDDFRFDVSGGGPNPDGKGDEYCGEVIDVVFVMDVSTSMDRFFAKLEADIAAVDAALEKLGPDTNPRYGLVVFVDDTKIINGGMAYTDIQSLRRDFQTWREFTSTNRQVNDPPCSGLECFLTGNQNNTWTENSLDALALAADAFDWRPADKTNRIIIHTTDDTFWEAPTVGNNVMIQHDYPTTVKKLQDQNIRVFSFAAKIGGQCGCDNVAPGFFEPYKGQLPIPGATLGGVFHILDVYNGTISLADAIPKAIDETQCDPYVPPS